MSLRLTSAELWYNSSFHSAIKCSPFKALYGVEPNLGIMPNWNVEEEHNSDAVTHVQQRQDMLNLLKTHLAAAQTKMKHYADKNRSLREFQVGELVYLKLQPFAQASIAHRPCAKLAFKFFGPFKILEKIGSVAYKLELPSNALIHSVFHVSQLKQHVPEHTPVFSDIPAHAFSKNAEATPEEIIDKRLVKKGKKAIVQIMVKWVGLPLEMSSWEDYNVLKERFPISPIWGPILPKGGECHR